MQKSAEEKRYRVVMTLKHYLSAPTMELAAGAVLNGLHEGTTNCLVQVCEVTEQRQLKKGGERNLFHAAELK